MVVFISFYGLYKQVVWHFRTTLRHTLKLLKLTYIFGLIWLTSCNDQPRKLSGVTETIEVSYVNWACDCANFIETKFYKNNSDYETKEEDCIFIEPFNKSNIIPDDYYDKGHFEYYLKLSGQFYDDKGVPNSYDQKTPEKPKKAKVFRYDSFELVKKNTNKSSIDLLTGTWVHEKDSLATLKIKDKSWAFEYEGKVSSDDEVYNINLTDKLPEFVKETEKAEFIILTNKTDTMYFEILGLNDKVLSLMNFPTGRLHLYNRK